MNPHQSLGLADRGQSRASVLGWIPGLLKVFGDRIVAYLTVLSGLSLSRQKELLEK